MKSDNIRRRLQISSAIAILAALLIALGGFLNISRMNEIIIQNDSSVVQPLAYLNDITFYIGKIESLVLRGGIIESDGETHSELFEEIGSYQDSIRAKINAYLDVLNIADRENTDEYKKLSEISVRISEWSQEIDSVARLAMNGQKQSAIERLYDTAIPKGEIINKLHAELIELNEIKASKSRDAADSYYMSTMVFMGVVLLAVTAVMIIFDYRIMKRVNLSVSEIVEARREAEQANRFKSDFLSNMSHEIRTPMNAILGMTQIANKSNDMEKIKDCVDSIENSSHHLLGLLNDILDMSKIEAGKLELNEETISLKESVSFAVSLILSKTDSKLFSIKSSIDIRNDIVSADSMRLNQVIINLLSNAVKFSPDGGEIDVSVREIQTLESEAVYEISVTDHGIGMNEEQVAKLFRAFEQADSGIAKRFGGTGLGLAISKNIVEMMNGKVWVESKEGIGSTFAFTVRLKTAAAGDSGGVVQKTETSQSGGEADFSNYRVLLVDDMEINRIIVVEMLSGTGITIDEASNGRETVEKFAGSEEGYYNLILLDVQMPEMDGYEATQIIRGLDRQDAKSVKIIAMTANAMKADIENARKAGMDGHIAKPIDFKEAMSVLSEALSK